MNKGYERKGIYSIEDVLSKILPTSMKKKPEGAVDFDGDGINMASQRYKVFKEKGTVCSTCGLKGLYFAKERSGNARRYHFNLYGLNDDGEEVMMTKDHVISKSLGRKNELSNYQTMCEPCNMAKGKQI